MLIALSRAFSLSRPVGKTWSIKSMSHLDKAGRTAFFKEGESLVKQFFARKPSYNLLVPALMDGGLDLLLSGPEIELGVPIKPMLGMITKDLNDMFTRTNLLAC